MIFRLRPLLSESGFGIGSADRGGFFKGNKVRSPLEKSGRTVFGPPAMTPAVFDVRSDRRLFVNRFGSQGNGQLLRGDAGHLQAQGDVDVLADQGDVMGSLAQA